MRPASMVTSAPAPWALASSARAEASRLQGIAAAVEEVLQRPGDGGVAGGEVVEVVNGLGAGESGLEVGNRGRDIVDVEHRDRLRLGEVTHCPSPLVVGDVGSRLKGGVTEDLPGGRRFQGVVLGFGGVERLLRQLRDLLSTGRGLGKLVGGFVARGVEAGIAGGDQVLPHDREKIA